VHSAQFDRLGVFSYSDEDTSRSYSLDGKVDARTIYNRKRRLMSIQRKISRRRNRALVGQTVPVLVEGLSPETDLLWQGRQPGQAPEIDGVTLINDFEGEAPRPGEIRPLLVTETHDYDVVGTLLAPEEPFVPQPQATGLINIQGLQPSFVVPNLIPAR
jgi:ribosomal protein S12 methylthiotransferase